MAMKMYPAIGSCNGCPNNIGGTCKEVDQRITDPTSIPLFCPLADHPAETIVRLITSLDSQRDAQNWGLSSVLINYIAAKLGLTLSAQNQSLTIPFTDKNDKEQSVWLRFDTLQPFDPRQGGIPFFDQNKVWILKLETSPPVLVEPLDDRPELTQTHELKVVR